MRALWKEARALEKEITTRDPFAGAGEVMRAVTTWSGRVSKISAAEPAPLPPPKATPHSKPATESTRVLRDPSPCIVRRAAPPAEAAPI